MLYTHIYGCFLKKQKIERERVWPNLSIQILTNVFGDLEFKNKNKNKAICMLVVVGHALINQSNFYFRIEIFFNFAILVMVSLIRSSYCANPVVSRILSKK